ncbi:putative uncharacterized protein [Bacteroides sp. CAG:875]|uniref:hypothetical protein n=1 Tax=Phocaeicola coprocola TaxID=310298 RepID=UPI000337FC3A|nr:hypothetical protein [Phocaeicola coprocola]MBM6903852.1 hypothetical protein [Phocaeicola coprocola]CDD51538.1 putative uncharacterized protein [Bacteroides sp. CAG:875]
MKIQIDRKKKILLLKWLQNGFIETNDIPELNEIRDNWFLTLMKETDAAITAEENNNIVENIKIKDYGSK